MTGPDLKPCPFCGGNAEIIDIDHGENAGGSCVCCTRCMASGNVEFGRKENFVSNWNRRATTPSAATAALARIERDAEARGMERAAARARVYASNYEQSSDGRNTFILLAEWADAEAAAILARAAEIEKDAK